VYTPADEGAPCTDDDACTTGDACDGHGACVTTGSVACDDAEACTADHCEPATGLCVHDGAPFEGQPCTHDDVCLFGTTCQDGACDGGVPINDCCHLDADCVTGEACETSVCQDHECVYGVPVCAGESAGCTVRLCDVGGGCDAVAVGLSGRVVLYERRFADESGVALRSDPVGAFSVDDVGLHLVAGVPAANLFLKPLRLPRGTTTLRFSFVAPETPADASSLVLVDRANGGSIPGQVVDLEPEPGFEVVYDVSNEADRTFEPRLLLQQPTWALVGVQAVHHGADGCPNAVGAEATTTLDATGTALQVTACASAAGERLVVWTESGQTASRLGWRLWDGQAWDAEKTAGGEFDVLPEFSLSCAAVGEGWFVAFGAIYSDGFKTAHLLRLDATGVAKSNSYVTLASGDHTEWPALGVMPNGDLLVAFASDLIDGDSTGIALARYKADGTAVGTENVLVNEVTNGLQRRPALAVGATTVLVAWESKLGSDKTSLRRRTFDLDLNPTTPDQTFAGSTSVEYLHPSAAALASPSEHFLVAYEAVGKTSPADADTGVYHTTFSVDGSVLINEQPLAYSKANDQVSPRVGVVGANALVSWRSDAADQYDYDLFEARIDSVGHQGNALVLKGGVQALGPALPDAPGAALYPYVKDGKVGLARLGTHCDRGVVDCSMSPVGVCVDADLYFPLVDGCLGDACTSVCP
jgi:hypothetical protein